MLKPELALDSTVAVVRDDLAVPNDLVGLAPTCRDGRLNRTGSRQACLRNQ
jgi:hypothetical protein